MLCSSGLLQKYGSTALTIASESGHNEVAELLLYLDADADAKDVFCSLSAVLLDALLI